MGEDEDKDELEIEPDDASFDPELMEDEESEANPWAKTSSGDADEL